MEGHECPTCETVFDSRRGLGVHHSSVHDERLPNRECENCGAHFYSDYEKKYCSEGCLDEAVSFEGKNNPNYDGGKKATTCELCDTSFDYYPSEKEGLYCPECVETASWRETPPLWGEQNPRWKGGKMQFDCVVCGTSVERYPSNVSGEVTVCGKDCLGDWLSEAFAGEGHPNWEGGGTGNYGRGWNRVRRQALERDGYECVVFGTTKSELGRNPDVHHIGPVRLFVRSDDHSVEDAHYLANVASLWISCHRKTEFGRIAREELRAAIGADLPEPPRTSGTS